MKKIWKEAEEKRMRSEGKAGDNRRQQETKDGQYAEWRNFSPAKFLNTGQEMLVEIRASLYTARGKMGLILSLAGFIWGLGEAKGAARGEFEPFVLVASLLWVAMGLAMLVTLENNKLLYLLPVCRKEFAALQIRRLVWIFLMVLEVMTLLLVCMNDAVFFLFYFFLKAIPFSGAMSIYTIAAIKPVKESQQTGKKIYQLSNAVILLVLISCFLNFIVFGDSWGALDWVLSVTDYGVNLFTVGYLYWKFGCADVYYDEI